MYEPSGAIDGVSKVGKFARGVLDRYNVIV